MQLALMSFAGLGFKCWHQLYLACWAADMCVLVQVGAAWGGLWGSTLRSWIPHWNIQPGVYGVMAGASVLAGVFRWVPKHGVSIMPRMCGLSWGGGLIELWMAPLL